MKRLLSCALILSVPFASMAEVLRFENPNGEVTIDGDSSGSLTRWRVGSRELVGGSGLTLKEGESIIPFRVTKAESQETKDGWKVVLNGKFDAIFSGSISYIIPTDFSRIEAVLNLDQPDEIPAQLRGMTWQFDLGLSPYKRVFFQGEHGLGWDTTYFYQFHTSALNQLLKNPDRNEWRFVGLDQYNAGAFRLWKSESDRTPPLLMQEGRKVAPYTQLYDAAKGVTVETPGLADSAPKRLLADASGGGAVRLELLPDRAPAFSVTKEEIERVLTGKPHRVVLYASEGEPALLALREALTKKSDLSVAPSPSELLAEAAWLKKAGEADGQPRYLTGGYPFGMGELASGKSVSVRIGGELVASQSRPLAYWPDGSVKWVCVTARLPQGAEGTVEKAPFITFRDGGKRAVEISVGEGGAGKGDLITEAGDEQVTITTGPLRVVLGKGRNWLRSVELAGVKVLTEQPVSAFANYRIDFDALSSTTGKLVGGEVDAGDLLVSRVETIESGPLRSIVRLEGAIPNREATKVYLWLEFLAGRSDIRITHTAEFLFQDPRKTALTSLGIRLPLAMENARRLKVAGLVGEVFLEDGEQVSLDQVTSNFYEIVEGRKGERKRVFTGGESRGWVLVEGEKMKVLAISRNFWKTAPKSLSYARDGAESGVLEFGLWPEAAGPMDVRRYSNYPHRGQSELAGEDNQNFEEQYYRSEPFVGLSRSHEMLLGFYPAKASVNPDACAADFESPPLLYAGWPRYEATKITLPGYVEGQSPLGAQALENYANFWRYHQALHRWYGFWNYGDFRHYFRDGYGWTVSPEKLVETLKAGPDANGKMPIAKKDISLTYRPANDWAFDNGRWGWGTTEGLPSYYLQNHYLRTGDRALYFAAEGMARYARDVVVRHAGKWFGAGTRHGVQPWSDGGHEERQTTATEYKLHHYLSGEPRTRDVSDRLYDRHYSKKPVSIHADHSGRLQGLLFHWELTNNAQEGEQLQKYIHAMAGESGIYEEAHLGFPGPVVLSPPKGLNGGSMFFQTFGAMHALVEYEMITSDPKLRSSLIAAADTLMANPQAVAYYGMGRMKPLAYGPLGFAARNAEDPTPYRDFIRKSFTAGAWKNTLQMVTENPRHWTGSTAYLGTTAPGSLFWMNFAPYLFGSLSEKESVTPPILAAKADLEEKGRPKMMTPIPLQDQYDHPDLKDYLGVDQPWRKPASK